MVGRTPISVNLTPGLESRGTLACLDCLTHALRQAAFFKIDAFVIKLEGHFQYSSAPAVVEPYALSPAELQKLTDYGLRYHIQLVPFLDGPAHIAFILKHPEYAGLREYPESNYELCATNPDSYKLLLGMYQDLLAANRGVKYFYLSTDEPYYIGKANDSRCHEAARERELGSVGRLLGEFLTKTANVLHDQDWFERVQSARNTYAQRHALAPRGYRLDWKDAGGGR